MSEKQQQPDIVPDAAQLERLRPWLERFGISQDLRQGSVRFTHDPGGMAVEWRSESGAANTDFLDDDDWDDARQLMRG